MGDWIALTTGSFWPVSDQRYRPYVACRADHSNGSFDHVSEASMLPSVCPNIDPSRADFYVNFIPLPRADIHFLHLRSQTVLFEKGLRRHGCTAAVGTHRRRQK
jgi:hypothetical protein